MYGNIIIDGERYVISGIQTYGDLPLLETDGGEFYVAESREKAGSYARDYWENMACNDKKEFLCMVGADTLVSWALGEYAGPGSTQVSSLDEWLDLWNDTPEEHWAGYDSTERDIKERGEGRLPEGFAVTKEAQEEIGFQPKVAYRHN
jgi:hypothetical protein